MATSDMTRGRRTGGTRHFYLAAPLLAILLLTGCKGCIEVPPPPQIKTLAELGWSVTQSAKLITVEKEKKPCTDADMLILAENGEELYKDGFTIMVVIAGSEVTDAGLANIKSLKNVSTLVASQTGVSGAGLAQIAGWTNLTSLDLSETKVDDEGLAHLAKLTKLDSLTLDGCPLTGAGLGSLKDLAELQSLRLNKTQVDDAGLATLPPLPKLRNLRLNDTQITDASIEHLKTLPALEELAIENVAGIKDEAVKAWEEANEDLYIER